MKEAQAKVQGASNLERDRILRCVNFEEVNYEDKGSAKGMPE